MIRYRYDFASLLPDYVRAVTGVTLTGGPVLFADVASVMLYILGGLAALFLTFGLRTTLRQVSCVELSANGIRVVGPFGAKISWEDLRGVDVRYFSTKRDRSDGWLQLNLRGDRRTISVDSSIGEFAGLVTRAAQAAEVHGVRLDAASRTNLGAHGIMLASAAAPARAADG
jgi:hypothetical protein